MQHHVVYDHDCLGRLIWHEFDTRAEAEVFAEVTQMKTYTYQDNTYDTGKISEAVNDYLNKKTKHIVVGGTHGK